MLLKNKIRFALLAFLMMTTVKLPAGHHCQQKQQRRCFTPYQVSLVAPAQTSPCHCDVNGVRANLIYGKNRNVSGIDIGLINHTTGNMNGYEVGIVNNVEGNVNGVQRGFVNHCSNVRGFQDGWVNVCDNRCTGMQSSLIYSGTKDMTGVQFGGCVSTAKRVRGLQIGLINCTKHLKGAQIGLLNIQTSRRYVKVLPILNISTSYGKPKCSRSCRGR